MGDDAENLENRILAAIRRIVRAIDQHSAQLGASHGLTAPQLVALRGIGRLGPVSVGALAREMRLSQPTVTGILARLERQGWIRRDRSERDRRTVLSTLTPTGAGVLRDAPSLLQDRFRRDLARLEEWEQTQILATLQRLATMMDAGDLPAAPVLTTESLAPPAEDGPDASEPITRDPFAAKRAERKPA